MIPTIRLADQSDIEVIVSYSRQLNEDDPSFTGEVVFDEQAVRRAVAAFLANPSLGQAWLILDDQTPIGYVIITLGYSLEYHGRDAFIDELFIEAGHRGQGIGSQVMKFVETACQELGINALHLEVERANTAAQDLYRKFGFADHDRILMTKWISREPTAQ
jgi:ribosomal protein S18 acetylase RimI-like enzyme